MIISPTGGGKTYLACAVGVAACHNEHTVHYTRMDVLPRPRSSPGGDGIDHQTMLNKLGDVDVLFIDDFLTAGIDPNTASDLFSVLANRDRQLPTIIVSQSGWAYWLEALPDKVAADSTVNRLANQSRTLNLGEVDMRRLRNQEAKATTGGWG
ncbi:Insertion sequence putative ATP-binding protein [Arthrobacter sp. SO5]|uniref:ATP-binding protein n=1 Tax=Arthrobacter sp. SO5 TaxID=1897055 RepID=UPI001E294C7E|nr:ATP-binding protein [Arthrobacter sp. SO5]MCB5273855.1 Insertion sequence putative ATP-binding protein [Arthrobacter sp. SO5]